LVKGPGEKKNNIVKKKYSNMLDDMKKFMEEVDKNVVEEDLDKMKENSEEQKFALLEFMKVQAESELGDM
jgi:excinuclease UvrABC nuclease subunit